MNALLAFSPIILLSILLGIPLLEGFELQASNALLLSALYTFLVRRPTFSSLDKIFQEVKSALSHLWSPIMILVLIGALVFSWTVAGVVPAMVYYGFKYLPSEGFLPLACLLCGVTSILTGSSWSTIATIGIALLGIGNIYGIPEPLLAGAIISGAYFGDKLSPFSDTTNLAASVTETPLITHIKGMLPTTIPAMSIALLGFFFFQFYYHSGTIVSSEAIQHTINDTFFINPFLLLVPFLSLLVIFLFRSVLIALTFGTTLGLLSALLFQESLMEQLTTFHSLFSQMLFLLKHCVYGLNFPVGESLEGVFNPGGIQGMLATIWLIICAMFFGVSLEVGGFLKEISSRILTSVWFEKRLVSGTITSSFFFNLSTADQYMAILIPGKMFVDIYKKKNIPSEKLSASLEDGGTVTSVLIPWNSCGATQAAVLGIATLSYAPFCFFNWLCPLISTVREYWSFKDQPQQ